MELINRVLEGWWHENSLTYSIVDTTELVDLIEPLLSNRITHRRIPLWSAVHLTRNAYRKLAEVIIDEGCGKGSDAGSTFSCYDSGATPAASAGRMAAR
jgi:hypothetical protein